MALTLDLCDICLQMYLYWSLSVSVIFFLCQVMSDLFTCLGDSMWTHPLDCAISSARLEELALIGKVDELQLGTAEDSAVKSSLSDLQNTIKQEPLLLSLSDNSVLSAVDTGSLSPTGSNLVKAENKRLSFSRDDSKRDSISSTDGEQELDEEELITLEVAFDPEKCVYCSIENG